MLLMLGRRMEAKEVESPDKLWPGYDSTPLLGPGDTQRYQSVAALLNFIALDRPELLYAVKELMRKMAAPTAQDEVGLKRVVRFLKTLPRLVASYAWAPLSQSLEIYTDSDHAGCVRTRRSTLGGCVLWEGGGATSRHGRKLWRC